MNFNNSAIQFHFAFKEDNMNNMDNFFIQLFF